MFTLALLPGRWAPLPGPLETDRKYFCHFSEPHAPEVIGRCFTIVPIRYYSCVQDSWRRRGMDLKKLERQWDRMLELRGVFFLPIDRPGYRERRLRELSAELGIELKTDWQPTNRLHMRQSPDQERGGAQRDDAYRDDRCDNLTVKGIGLDFSGHGVLQ